jgi:hypothetical protein
MELRKDSYEGCDECHDVYGDKYFLVRPKLFLTTSDGNCSLAGV